MKFKLNARLLTSIIIASFVFSSLFQLMNLITIWGGLNFWSRGGMIIGVFTSLFFAFFFWFSMKSQQTQILNQKDYPEIMDAIKDLKEEKEIK